MMADSIRPSDSGDTASSARILIVDDSLTVRMSLQTILFEEGYEVFLASCADEGLECLRRECVDVILLDLIMPGKCGKEMLHEIKAHSNWASISVLLLTAVSDRQDLVECLDAGADDFVVKPWDRNELMGRLRALVRLKRALDTAEESAIGVRRILEATMEGIQGIDEHGRTTFINPVAANLLGLTPEEAIGRSATDLFYAAGEAVGASSNGKSLVAEAMLDSSSAQRFEDIFWRSDGVSYPVEVSIAAIRDANEKVVGAVVSFRDVGEARALQAQLSQAQKLESIGQLAAGIAHEINTPSQYVGDNLEFLEQSFGEVSELLKRYRALQSAAESGEVPSELIREVSELAQATDIEFLEEEIPRSLIQSREGIGRVSKIVQAMKDFSHPGSAEKAPVNLNRAIESTLTVARNEWKFVAELETEFDADLPAVPCFAGEFNQVVLNMVVNASHALAEVQAERESKEKGMIRVRTRCEGREWAVVEISDNGAGMSEEILTQIFVPFFTTKEVGKGTGQGLAIAHSVIVDKHGGRIEVESVVGEGTTFLIWLPLGTPNKKEVNG